MNRQRVVFVYACLCHDDDGEEEGGVFWVCMFACHHRSYFKTCDQHVLCWLAPLPLHASRPRPCWIPQTWTRQKIRWLTYDNWDPFDVPSWGRRPLPRTILVCSFRMFFEHVCLHAAIGDNLKKRFWIWQPSERVDALARRRRTRFLVFAFARNENKKRACSRGQQKHSASHSDSQSKA